MIYLRNKERKDINLKISGFSYNFINYSYLTCKAFVENNVKDEIFTKGYFIDDILSSIHHNQTLIYAFNDTTLELNEAYYITESIIYLITKKIFSTEYLVDRELEILKICITEKENIKMMFSKEKSEKSIKELKEFDELLSKYHPVKEYQLKSFYTLLQRVQGDMCNIQLHDAIYEYYSNIVMFRVIKANEKQYPSREFHLNIIQNFIYKDESTFKYLIKNIIQQLFEKEEINISTHETKNNFLMLDNYLKRKIALIQ